MRFAQAGTTNAAETKALCCQCCQRFNRNIKRSGLVTFATTGPSRHSSLILSVRIANAVNRPHRIRRLSRKYVILICHGPIPVPVLVSAAMSCNVAGAMTVSLFTNRPTPQPVGTPIGLAAHVENSAKGMLVPLCGFL
jgi:hypothetical protein